MSSDHDPSRPRGITVVNHALIRREPEAVFDFLTDLEREPDWNAKLLEVVPLTGGPPRSGSAYDVRFPWPVGRSRIVYESLDRPHLWRTRSTARWLGVRFTGAIAQADSGSDVTLTTVLLPRGPLRLLGPVLGRTMRSSWDGHLRTIKDTLESADPR